MCVRPLRRSPGLAPTPPGESTRSCSAMRGRGGQGSRASELGATRAAARARAPTRTRAHPVCVFRPPAGPAAPPGRTGTRLRVPGHDGQRESPGGRGAAVFRPCSGAAIGPPAAQSCVCVRTPPAQRPPLPPSHTPSPATPALAGACMATRTSRQKKKPTTLTPIHLPPSTHTGGRLVVQYLRKKPSAPKCGVTGVALQGVSVWGGRGREREAGGREARDARSRPAAPRPTPRFCLTHPSSTPTPHLPDPGHPPQGGRPRPRPQARQDGAPRVWRSPRPLRRQGAHRARVPGRGAEDRQKGFEIAEGEGREVKQACVCPGGSLQAAAGVRRPRRRQLWDDARPVHFCCFLATFFLAFLPPSFSLPRVLLCVFLFSSQKPFFSFPPKHSTGVVAARKVVSLSRTLRFDRPGRIAECHHRRFIRGHPPHPQRVKRGPQRILKSRLAGRECRRRQQQRQAPRARPHRAP